MKKTKIVMKDYSKRANMRYVVVGPPTFGWPGGVCLDWYPSLAAALAAHPDARPAAGCQDSYGNHREIT